MPVVGSVMARAQEAPLDRSTLREAAQWLMRLHAAAEPAPEAFRQWEQWRALHPDNERAWQRAQQFNTQFGTELGALPPGLAHSTLNRKMPRRKALAAIGGLAVGLPAAWTAWRMAPIAAWAAEYRTATGGRRDIRLADGSTVQMNTSSALDVAFDATVRRIILRSGEILVRTAGDTAHPAVARPFLVSTDAGVIRTLDARFTVRQTDGDCRVSVLDGSVDVTPAGNPGQRLRVGAGLCVRFTRASAGPVQPVLGGTGEWARGVLVADNMRLADFLDELARYRPGIVRCDPAVADLRLSGGFQLQDTDRVLSLLPATLPVQVVTRTRYWVMVQPRTGTV
ncbi:FecR domain-containing protein [Achromobacter seleniivolatilans]|uniref:FecR domain-containing protein n=1 Tax=Achromobacter seleniivolatilans TaxID=3047478 RepID=A0ABY9LTQ1_9BURK|nr:FecR domain-containing protein [Achromobacter sp. R39]WMD18141.1 FecR domain-containing protein [Achromobacter sp. R39]